MKVSEIKIVSFLFTFLFTLSFSQSKVSGTTKNENDMIITSVLIVNVSNDQKTMSNDKGDFDIEASNGDEIRFSKTGYERASVKVNLENTPIPIVLVRIPEQLETVKIIALSGNLKNDSKKVDKEDKIARLQKDIGLPKSPEKPREKPADVKEVVVGALLGGLNVQGVYDLVSGKARRQKNWYRYEDVHDDIKWVRKSIEDDYFVKAEIPTEKINEFLEFSFILKPEIRAYIKAKNLSKVMWKFEDVIPIYTDRLRTLKK